MGRGEIERAFETIQQQFTVEVTGDEAHPARHQVTGLAELNDLLDRRVRAVYHARPHSETGQAPLARYAAAGPASCPSRCCCARRSSGARSGWSAYRDRRLEGNVFSVDPFLAGRRSAGLRPAST